VVRIWNGKTITLQTVEDHSGNWHRALGKHFGTISDQPLKFPSSLGPLYLELTSFQGNMFHVTDGRTKEGILQLQTDSGNMESFWFALSSSGTLTAYRFSKLNHFECVFTWTIDQQTVMTSSPSPSPPCPSSSLLPAPAIAPAAVAQTRDGEGQEEGGERQQGGEIAITKVCQKRNFQTSFHRFCEDGMMDRTAFQITFSSSSACTVAPKESSCRYVGDSSILTDPRTILLCAPNSAARSSWMELLQQRIESNADDTDDDNDDSSSAASSTCSSPGPSPSMSPSPPPSRCPSRSTNGFHRSATTESVLSQQGYINLPPIQTERYEELTLSPLHCQTSPILIKLFWHLATTLELTASPLYRVLGKTGTVPLLVLFHLFSLGQTSAFPREQKRLSSQEFPKAPHTPDLSFLAKVPHPHPTPAVPPSLPSSDLELRSLDLERLGIDPSDPDILFLSWGGFIHYNFLGTVIGATALSELDTQYFIQYSSPETLHPEDAHKYDHSHLPSLPS
jgi:hypothetical protein